MNNNNISDKTASELLKAFEQMANSTPYVLDEMEKLMEAMIDSTARAILFKEALLHLKYLEASVFTRWYWKRKHEKAKIESDKIKDELSKIILSKTPIPNISFDDLLVSDKTIRTGRIESNEKT